MGKLDESGLAVNGGREVVNTIGESLLGYRWRRGMNTVSAYVKWRYE